MLDTCAFWITCWKLGSLTSPASGATTVVLPAAEGSSKLACLSSPSIDAASRIALSATAPATASAAAVASLSAFSGDKAAGSGAEIGGDTGSGDGASAMVHHPW